MLMLVTAKAQDINFRRYQVENGLSNNQVWCSIQDAKGFLWFGTPDGLNRFDGYTFKVFLNNGSDKPGTANSHIRALCLDGDDRLWVGTEKGLYNFDPHTERFRLLPTDALAVISGLQTDNQGYLWFISDYTLHKYNPQTGAIVAYPASRFFKATALCMAGNQLWVASSGGLLQKYNPATDTFTAFDLFKGAAVADKNKWIDRLYATSEGDVLIGTATHGASIFFTRELRFAEILTYNDDKTSLFAKAFVTVNNHEYWIGTESAGIVAFNRSTGAVSRIKKAVNDPYTLSDNSINTFCTDKEGGIWVGTHYGGLNYYSAKYDVFSKFYPKQCTNSLSGNVIRQIHEDKNGCLWMGTADAGLNKLDPETGVFSRFMPNAGKQGIAYNNVHGMLVDGDNLWVGTYVHGLDVMDIKTGAVKQHYAVGKDSGSLKSDIINYIYRSADSQIYVATARGVYTYNRTTHQFSVIKELADEWYTCLFKDAGGTLWAGTIMHGMKAVNTATGKTVLYQHHADNTESIGKGQINCIYSDSKQQLWVGTDGGGLCLLNSDKNGFTRYTVNNGLPSDFVLTILEDDAGKLWVSTSRGLFSYHLNSGYVKVYTKANGLLCDQFNYHSAYKNKKGRMYFGSLKGLISFDPKMLENTAFEPPLYLTGIQVNNKELFIGGENAVLQKSVTWTNEIVLTHQQSSFSIDFAALNYTAPEATEYAYRMEGLEKDWTCLKENRRVYFTNVSAGTYLFKVKASAGGNQWTGKERTLQITILPPWWLSTKAYLLYIAAGIGIMVLLVKVYKQKVENTNKRKMEQLEIAKAKALYEDKLNFFTNVAHEIKTPLTLIKGPLETVLKTVGDTPDVAGSLKIMDRNTNRLIELTNQLLDFRQTEIGGLRLNFVHTHISALLLEMFESFKPLAASRGLQYTLSLPEAPLYAWIDADAFHKIISNLFSNAIKYAESRVWVNLAGVVEDGRLWVVNISNDGYIIPADMADRIFEPFFRLQATKKRGGAGIGLSLAQNLAHLHNGRIELAKTEGVLNTFSLILPVQQNA